MVHQRENVHNYFDELEGIPWINMVLDFLSFKDVLQLSGTCRYFRARSGYMIPAEWPSLQKSAFFRGEDFKGVAKKWQTLDFMNANGDIMIPNPHLVHSVIIKYRWRDQGWGNRKGTLFVVKNDGKAPNDYAAPNPKFVIAQSKDVAQHEWSTALLSFRPERLEVSDDHPNREPFACTYHLWERTGGGGGHSLYISDLEIRCLICVAHGELVEYQL